MNGQPDEVLDSGLIADIPKTKELFEKRAQFHWEFYSELAYLRNQIYDALKTSLREVAAPFEFLGWQRAVKYKYSLDPLSTKGSLVDPGGRFNIGAMTRRAFPCFRHCTWLATKRLLLPSFSGETDPRTPLRRKS
jgi:hypothetical protein